MYIIKKKAFNINEEKLVRVGTRTIAVNITPKTEPIVLINNTKPDFASLLWSLLLFIIDIKIGFKADNKTNGIERSKKLPIKLPNNKFMFKHNWKHVFLHGEEIRDFHKLDKQKLFALNFSATQELDRQQQADKAEIAELKTEVATLKSELATIKAHLGI